MFQYVYQCYVKLLGVLQWELNLIFKHFLQSGYLTVPIINNVISQYEFGYIESKDRPSSIDFLSENDKKLGQSGMLNMF